MVEPIPRLVQIAEALTVSGIRFLIMGGHAVRFYGVDRNTLDFDFQISANHPPFLAALNQSKLSQSYPVTQGDSWRPDDFLRFQIGVLPSGKEEWLEFWLRNHLLSPFEEAYSRREQFIADGIALPYLALPDLIRSKETERDDDWHDVRLLEEILDERNLHIAQATGDFSATLANLRSRRGFDRLNLLGVFSNAEAIERALAEAPHPVTLAYLAPFSRRAEPNLSPEVKKALQVTSPGSARHTALVEAVRLQYQRAAKLADRADKESRQHR